MTATVQEKRRYPRKPMEQPAEVLDNDTGTSLGSLENVSRGGFSLLTDQGLRPSETRNVTLMLPGPQGSTHTVNMIAECVWCQSLNGRKGHYQTDDYKKDAHTKDSHRQHYAAGFLLKEINDQDAVALNYFIRDYQVVAEQELAV